MINKLRFAWVAEEEQFDPIKHEKNELNVLEITIDNHAQSDGVFAIANLLIEEKEYEKIQFNKFLLISMKTEDEIIPLFKGKMMTKETVYDQEIFLQVQFHAKPSNYYEQRDNIYEKYGFDRRFLLKERYSSLIDSKIMWIQLL